MPHKTTTKGKATWKQQHIRGVPLFIQHLFICSYDLCYAVGSDSFLDKGKVGTLIDFAKIAFAFGKSSKSYPINRNECRVDE